MKTKLTSLFFATILPFTPSFVLTANESCACEEVREVSHTIVQRPAMTIVGIECRTSNTRERAPQDIPAHWEKFCSEEISQQIPNKLSDEVIGLYCNYEGDHTKEYSLIIGCPVSSVEELPEGLVAKEVAGGSYALFSVSGEFPESLINTWCAIWRNNNLKRSYTTDYELYTTSFLNSDNHELEVFIALEPTDEVIAFVEEATDEEVSDEVVAFVEEATEEEYCDDVVALVEETTDEEVSDEVVALIEEETESEELAEKTC